MQASHQDTAVAMETEIIVIHMIILMFSLPAMWAWCRLLVLYRGGRFWQCTWEVGPLLVYISHRLYLFLVHFSLYCLPLPSLHPFPLLSRPSGKGMPLCTTMLCRMQQIMKILLAFNGLYCNVLPGVGRQRHCSELSL